MSAWAACSRRFVFAAALATAAIAAQPASAKELYLRRWPAGVPTPQLQLSSPDGREWNLRNLRGKVVVLNFWASWCEPCVEEIPFLDELANSAPLAGKVTVLGINFKESATAIQRFADAHPFRYPVLMDKSGEQFKQWGKGVLPATILIDRHGQARWVVMGELDRNDDRFRTLLEKMLAE